MKKAITFVENKVGKKKGWCVGTLIKSYPAAGFDVVEYKRRSAGWAVWDGEEWICLDENETGAAVVIDDEPECIYG